MAKNELKVRLRRAACPVPEIDICDNQDSSFNKNVIPHSIWKLRIPVDSPALSLQFAFDFYSFRPYLHHQISHYFLTSFKWPTIFVHLSSWRDTKNRYKKVSLKLCQKHPNIIPKHRWKPATETWDSFNTCLGTSRIGTREPGGRGQVAPTNLEALEASPPPPHTHTLDSRCHSFIFWVVFARNLCLPQK